MLRSVMRRFPLTIVGWSAVALSALAFFHGARRQDMILTLAGVWGLVVVAATGICVLLRAWRARRDMRLAVADAGDDALEGVESRPMPTGVAVPRRAWPLVSDLTWRWREPPAHVRVTRADGRLVEVAAPRSRWLGDRVVRAWAVRDLLGLWRVRGTVRHDGRVLVLPDPGRLTAADVAACLSSGDLLSHPLGEPRGDRIDFRTYTRSDPARLILWKVYARTRELMVRVPEPARTHEMRPLVYLMTGEHDDAAAGLARLLMESGVLGDDARFAADGCPVPLSERREIREAIAGSRAHRERGGKDLARTMAHESIGNDDPIILLCPGFSGGWSRHALHQLTRRPDRFLVIVAGDVEPEREPQSGWRRLVWRDQPGSSAPVGTSVRSRDLLRTARPLVTTGSRVLMADRRAGSLTRLSGEARDDQGFTALGGAA